MSMSSIQGIKEGVFLLPLKALDFNGCLDLKNNFLELFLNNIQSYISFREM